MFLGEVPIFAVQNTSKHVVSLSKHPFFMVSPATTRGCSSKVEKRLLELKEKTEALQTQNDYLGTCHGGREL